MKTKALTTIILSILFVSNLAAVEKLETEKSDAIILKEWVVKGTERQIDDKKVVYESNDCNQMLSKTVFRQNRNGEWISSQKYEYSYRSTNDTLPSSLSYAKWNGAKEVWSDAQRIDY